MIEKLVKASSVETEAGLQQKELNALRSCTKTKSSYAYLLYWKFMQILYQQDIWLYLIPIKTSLVFTSGRIWCKSPYQHTSIYRSCKLHCFFIRVWALHGIYKWGWNDRVLSFYSLLGKLKLTGWLWLPHLIATHVWCMRLV